MSIGFEINNRLAVITIDRPEAMNALDMAHNAELDRIWAEFRDDDDLWVAILTGAGDKAFSAGADLLKGIINSATCGPIRPERYCKPCFA